MSDQILIEALIKKLGVQAKFEANLSSGYDHTHNHKQTDKHRLVETKQVIGDQVLRLLLTRTQSCK